MTKRQLQNKKNKAIKNFTKAMQTADMKYLHDTTWRLMPAFTPKMSDAWGEYVEACYFLHEALNAGLPS